jgi:hypothetical protein
MAEPPYFTTTVRPRSCWSHGSASISVAAFAMASSRPEQGFCACHVG